MKSQPLLALIVSLVILSPFPALAAEELPEYVPAQLENGQITSVGSDSMEEIVVRWVELYRELQPTVNVQVASFGSASAPPALIEGTANLGHMARPMKGSELEDFKLKYGFEPTEVRAALVGVAVYVSTANPKARITFDELDAVFSSARLRSGSAKPAARWSDLGINTPLGEEPILAVRVKTDALPSIYFKQQVLLQAGYAHTVEEKTDTESVLRYVATNPNAIGFGSFVELTAEQQKRVKVLSVSRDQTSSAELPTMTSIQDGTYPLARALHLYIVRTPGRPVDPAVRDFLTFALSRQGQGVVVEKSLVPLSPEIAAEELEKLR